MKEPTKRSILLFWLPLGLAIAAFLLVPLVGSVLVIGSKLGASHPLLEWMFYSGLLLIFTWLLAVPVIAVFTVPVLALEDVAGATNNVSYKTLKRVAKQLVKSGTLPPDQHAKLAGAIGLGSDLLKPLAAAITIQKDSAAIITRAHAVRVFITTAVSQSGHLDAIAVLMMNFKLVRTLVDHFGYRPPLPMLIKIYSQIFFATIVAEEASDIDLSGAFSHVGLGVLNEIPGASLIADSVFDGTINAMFTLRVGYVTQKYLLNAGRNLSKSDIRKSANESAGREIKHVMKESVPFFPAAMGAAIRRLYI